MSTGSIGAELRRQVAARADHLCEYCLIHERDTFFGCEVDHVVSLKHSGPTREDNLAYACFFCNRNKGSDIASRHPESGELVRLFNPRTDRWVDHFLLDEANGLVIVPLSDVGLVTERILKLNQAERLLERQALAGAGRYPCGPARSRMVRSS